MKCCGAIDLHSNNACLGILDEDGNKLFKKKFPNDLSVILSGLEPFKEKIDEIAVESTYNWYWLVDGLIENGYNVCLANPAAMKQYDGLKYSEDFSEGISTSWPEDVMQNVKFIYFQSLSQYFERRIK